MKRAQLRDPAPVGNDEGLETPFGQILAVLAVFDHFGLGPGSEDLVKVRSSEGVEEAVSQNHLKSTLFGHFWTLLRVLDRGGQVGHGWDGARVAISRVEGRGSRTVLGPF